VHSLGDEPGVHRVWLPDRDAPGLAMSRAFGDYCVKDYGVISAPEVTRRRITARDQFVILATDGVCNQRSMFLLLLLSSSCSNFLLFHGNWHKIAHII
jgi:serine/threonine protein phosphatase PrpC